MRDGSRASEGDEFAFVLRCDPAGPDQPLVDPAVVAERIIDAMDKPFALTSGSAQIGVSVGIGLTRLGSDSIDDLIHRADVALYRAKAEGRGLFSLLRTRHGRARPCIGPSRG